jgi:uncharacterized protein YcnI
MGKISWWLARRMFAVGALCALALVTLIGTASAHVTANPGTAQQGGFTKISFRVPNERDTASTTQLEISFPTDHPIAFVATRAIPGWTSTVQKAKLDKPIKTEDGEISEVVSKITWSGGKIPPGSFEDFDVSMGPLPTDTDELVFKALQTYSNGEVVRWIDTATEGAPEPEHPAPVVKLTPANPAQAAAAAATGPGDAQSSTGRWGVVLGIVGIVLGLIGIIVGLVNRRSATAG